MIDNDRSRYLGYEAFRSLLCPKAPVLNRMQQLLRERPQLRSQLTVGGQFD